MIPRFHAPDLDLYAGDYVIGGAERHHLGTVKRLSVGDQVELFTGTGVVAIGEILELSKREAVVKIVSAEARPEPEGTLLVGAAFPKGDRADLLVEKLTELGATRLVPLLTERSVTDPGAGKLDRLRRTIVEACKQSRRDHLMELAPPSALPDFLQSPGGWLLDPCGDPIPSGLAPPTAFAIGPEGGWSDAELTLAGQRGWRVVRLAGPILRVETAAITMAAWRTIERSRDG